MLCAAKRTENKLYVHTFAEFNRPQSWRSRFLAHTHTQTRQRTRPHTLYLPHDSDVFALAASSRVMISGLTHTYRSAGVSLLTSDQHLFRVGGRGVHRWRRTRCDWRGVAAGQALGGLAGSGPDGCVYMRPGALSARIQSTTASSSSRAETRDQQSVCECVCVWMCTDELLCRTERFGMRTHSGRPTY